MEKLTIKKIYTVTYHVEKLEDNGSQVGGYYTVPVGKPGLTLDQAIQLLEYSNMIDKAEEEYYIVADVESESQTNKTK